MNLRLWLFVTVRPERQHTSARHRASALAMSSLIQLNTFPDDPANVSRVDRRHALRPAVRLRVLLTVTGKLSLAALVRESK
jgi:hypothetical protein